MRSPASLERRAQPVVVKRLGILRPLASALVAAALIATTTGCAGLRASPSVPVKDQNQGTPKATASTSAAPTVTAARRRLHATLGIQVFWNSNGTPAEQEADANRVLNYVVGLGANSVAIDFFFFTNGVHPTRVYGVPGRTPSPATIGMVIRQARKRGLRVLVRPLLNEDNIEIVGSNWRGSIQPPSMTTWFASYWSFLKPYLVASQHAHATAFNIGTELDSLAPYKNHWTIFEHAVGQVFTGKQMYAVNYGRWQEDPSYEPVPDAAVDAYPQLGLGNDATVQALTTAWVSWLHRQPESVLHGTVLQEVGIAAAAGAYREPAYAFPAGTPLDIPIQQKWFTAACAAAKQASLTGIYFYAVNSTDRPSDHALVATYGPGSFIGRSDGVIKSCFASGWG